MYMYMYMYMYIEEEPGRENYVYLGEGEGRACFPAPPLLEFEDGGLPPLEQNPEMDHHYSLLNAFRIAKHNVLIHIIHTYIGI